MPFNRWCYFKTNLLLLIVFVCGLSCKSDKQRPVENNLTTAVQTPILSIPDSLIAGKLYHHVAINGDELNSFALYLPKLYQPNFAWPVIFFFDAGGNGSLPLKKYQNLADSLGYIFVGSNVSKNGQSIDETLMIWNTIKNSCLNHFAIDRNRIILAGFSGGARVCCAIAFQEKTIQGIIANSAGAPQLEQILNQNSFFIGLSGKGDMNRAEMIGIEQHLSSYSSNHFYIEFDGIHEWAPVESMKKALVISTLQSYLKNPSLLNSAIIGNFVADQQMEIEQLKAKGKMIEAYHELVLLTRGTKGLNNSPLENLDSLKNHPDYIQQSIEFRHLNTKETEMQQELYELMSQKPDLKAWKNQIEQIRRKSLSKNNVGQMNQRLLGYASLICYSLSNRNLMAKNYSMAEIMVDCYEIADPKNAEVYFFKAIITGAKGDKANTITLLKKSIQLGLNDKVRIGKQAEFNFIKQDQAFLEMLK